MISDFRKKKLMFLFKIMFKVDENSTIEKKDFVASREFVAKAQGWQKDDSAYKEFQDFGEKIWKELSKNTQKINGDEWVSVWNSQGELPEWQKMFCKTCFLILDPSGDGNIDKEEFLTTQEQIGISRAEATEAFEKMSRGKSDVSWDEFLNLFKEYLQSEDVNAPGNYIFGSIKCFT